MSTILWQCCNCNNNNTLLLAYIGTAPYCYNHLICDTCIFALINRKCLDWKPDFRLSTDERSGLTAYRGQLEMIRISQDCPGPDCDQEVRLDFMGNQAYCCLPIQYADVQYKYQLPLPKCRFCSTSYSDGIWSISELFTHQFRCPQRQFQCRYSDCGQVFTWRDVLKDSVKLTNTNTTTLNRWTALLNQAHQLHYRTNCKHQTTCPYRDCAYSNIKMSFLEAFQHEQAHKQRALFFAPYDQMVDKLQTLVDTIETLTMKRMKLSTFDEKQTFLTFHNATVLPFIEKLNSLCETTNQKLLEMDNNNNINNNNNKVDK